MENSAHQQQVESGERFEFGDNWRQFLSVLNEQRITLAETSLREALGDDKLDGLRFIDAGSGSGLFSLAARRLGATVHSFDFDPASVACTAELRRRYFSDDDQWIVEEGSVLDRDYLSAVPPADIVYSWGVLHHTGGMWQAMENVAPMVRVGGRLFVAIYNDAGWRSRYWLRVKRLYNAMPRALRWLILVPAAVQLKGPSWAWDLLTGRPFYHWRNYAQTSARGMSASHDLIDWVGGLPYEYARPEEIVHFYRDRGFSLEYLQTCGGKLGCNQFVFRRGGDNDDNGDARARAVSAPDQRPTKG